MPPKKKTTKKIIKKDWSESHVKRYNSLYNYVSKQLGLPYEKDNYLSLHKKKIFKIISDNGAWMDGTKEGYFFMVARYLFNINNKDKYSKLYSEEGFRYLQENKERTGKNELDEKEKDNFRTHEYFLNIISTFSDTTAITELQHMKQLLLKLLVFQPPLRTSFYTSCFIARRKKDNDGVHNYVYLNRQGKPTAHYIVNKDKASNYKLYSMNKKFSTIELSKEATKAINDSLMNYGRNYLFEINNKPISQNTLLSWLRDITNTPKINIDMMRASYITWFHGVNGRFADRDKLSHQIRHSQNTASQNYRKILDDEDTSTNVECIETKKKLVIYDLKIKELENQLAAYSENKTDSKLFNKRRSDALYNLNVKNRTPRESTLEKYKIVFDKEKEIYTI